MHPRSIDGDEALPFGRRSERKVLTFGVMAFDAKPGPPPDITIPQQGSTTARGLFSMTLRRLLEDLKALQPPDELSTDARRGYRSLREVLAELLLSQPAPVASALRRPTVSAPLRCARDRSGDIEHAIVELTGQLLFELSQGVRLPRTVKLTRAPRRLLSLGWQRVVEVPSHAGEVGFGGQGVAIDGDPIDFEASQGSRTYRPIRHGLVLALADNNPLSMHEAHPDKEGNAVDLGGRPVEEWIVSLQGALSLIEAHLSDLYREMRMLLQQIIPVGYDEERHVSASYKEAIGTIYVSLHPDQMTMAEALIHEFSHNKINALLELDPLLENGLSELHESPVRPDPRPLNGVLLAVHAFLPVAYLYERMIESGHPWAERSEFRSRYRSIVESNGEGTRVLLEHARPTEVGRGVLNEIQRWNDHFGAAAA